VSNATWTQTQGMCTFVWGLVGVETLEMFTVIKKRKFGTHGTVDIAIVFYVAILYSRWVLMFSRVHCLCLQGRTVSSTGTFLTSHQPAGWHWVAVQSAVSSQQRGQQSQSIKWHFVFITLSNQPACLLQYCANLNGISIRRASTHVLQNCASLHTHICLTDHCVIQH